MRILQQFVYVATISIEDEQVMLVSHSVAIQAIAANSMFTNILQIAFLWNWAMLWNASDRANAGKTGQKQRPRLHVTLQSWQEYIATNSWIVTVPIIIYFCSITDFTGYKIFSKIIWVIAEILRTIASNTDRMTFAIKTFYLQCYLKYENYHWFFLNWGMQIKKPPIYPINSFRAHLYLTYQIKNYTGVDT